MPAGSPVGRAGRFTARPPDGLAGAEAAREPPGAPARPLLLTPPVSRRARVRVDALAAFLLLLAAGVALAEGPEPWTWHLVEAPVEGKAVHAVAVDASRGRLAVGGATGIAFREPGGAWRRRRLRGPVQDLAFAADGALWVATAQGLFRVAGEGSVADRSPAPGEPARDVRRVLPGAAGLAVATGAGVFWSADGERWLRPDGRFASLPARSVALQVGPAETRLWSLGDEDLVHARLDRPGASGVLEALPVAARPLADLALDWGMAVVVAAERALVVREAPASAWTLLRPALPPGARVRRLARGAGRLWLLTDRGVLDAERVSGPWRRVAPPVGDEAARALASDGTRVWVAGDAGLWEGAAPSDARSPRVAHPAPCDPPIRAVQRAALAGLDLDPGHVRRLRRGVTRRGLLPVVSLRATRSDERSFRFERDEAFISGDLRRLFDRDDDRAHETELTLTFSWDLGTLLYHPEQIDVSQEARRLIELRSDVLDEINQLYFQRRRVLAERRESAPGSPEALQLELRARELAAGLDGWTDGWFGRELAGSECPSPR